jgi:hypothetical protein
VDLHPLVARRLDELATNVVLGGAAESRGTLPLGGNLLGSLGGEGRELRGAAGHGVSGGGRVAASGAEGGGGETDGTEHAVFLGEERGDGERKREGREM